MDAELYAKTATTLLFFLSSSSSYSSSSSSSYSVFSSYSIHLTLLMRRAIYLQDTNKLYWIPHKIHMEITQQQDQDLKSLAAVSNPQTFFASKICSCLFVLERALFFLLSRKGGNVSRSMEKRFSNDLTLPFEPFQRSPKRKGALFFCLHVFSKSHSPLPTSFGEICILYLWEHLHQCSVCGAQQKHFSLLYFS